MEDILKSNDKNLFKDYVYNIHPVYKYYGKSLTYKEYYNMNLKELNEAFNRIYKKIDLNKIFNIIDNTLYMSDIRKDFLKKAIEYRKKNILDTYYKNI